MAAVIDYYAALEVDRTATPEQIRSAYRRLARRHHPDVNPGNKAAEARFKEISAAYDVLSDAEKRAKYDERENARRHNATTADAADPFAGSPRQRAGTTSTTVELDFVIALRGGEIEVPLPVEKACPMCGGTGVQPGSTLEVCPLCDGAGRTSVRSPQSAATSPAETILVRIPPGTDDGSELRVRARGAQQPASSAPHELLIKVHVRPHSHFRRDGLDLHLKLPISLEEAYAGATIEVPTPKGPVRMKVPPRSQPGARLRLRHKGVERGTQRGDLHVELDVRLPDREDAQLLAALRDSSRLYARPLRDGIKL